MVESLTSIKTRMLFDVNQPHCQLVHIIHSTQIIQNDLNSDDNNEQLITKSQ